MSWNVDLGLELGAFRLAVELEGDSSPVALVGPNGSGKTTLLRAVAGALTPLRGRIRVGSSVLFDSSESVDTPIERRRVGYVPQGSGLFPHLRVLDNVAYGVPRGSGGPADRRRRALEMLDELESASLAARRPAELSGGERQRVALARALVIDPRLLLLDEPLSAIDASARRRLRTVLAARLRRAGRPSIVVTHDVRDVAALGARVYVLDAGRVAQQGSLGELRADPANDFVAEFVDVAPAF